MNFIFAWLISSTAVFVLEIVMMFVERLIGDFFNFSFDNEISISKIKRAFFFSVTAGIVLTF